MLPLKGVTVIEFCQIAAGPFAGMLLADMGADVIKVEAPGGDGMREWPPFTDGYSENFASLNRNKRSVVFNLKSDQDVARARSLCARADVVLENFRPGVMDRLGLGYETLSRDAPNLVYCSISAFGQVGPRATEGGFDVTLQAMAGVMSVTGEPDGAPVKCGVPISDFAAGLYAAYGVASMLLRVQSGGSGGHIDVPMLGATLGIAALQVSEYFGNGENPKKLGSAHPRNAPYQAFKCKDDYFVMAAGNNDLFERACRALGRPELISDLRFASSRLRAKHQIELKELLEVTLGTLTAQESLTLMREAGVPCAPINTYAQALSDPQTAHYGWVRPLDLPNGSQTETFTFPLKISDLEFGVYRRPPNLGEHTREVVASLEVADGRRAP
jgi:crotonobetainyl-CoA:carnitine CoA-transferase CaiB-like acyl-CoA transferase